MASLHSLSSGSGIADPDATNPFIQIHLPTQADPDATNPFIQVHLPTQSDPDATNPFIQLHLPTQADPDATNPFIQFLFNLSITSITASVGPGAPQAAFVILAIVLTAVGLPLNDIQLVLAVDWFLDRLLTSVNVLGDAFGAGIVEHLSRHDLHKMDAIAETVSAEAGNASDSRIGLTSENGHINE
ncbi:excitatory amino acid transporter-like [Lingula anatina]|uniref:Amino acid transporter n=1 Tax=Lingula anatina TaxID=7574 RepID=A0A1S3IW05_LINAN|nr:excitatory amino acid transporter-like [Lingula anatina]|eukprot:XP_013401734.1 excitatory amino acid transporter-like [Lingula anatina]